tara:strand:- start:2972 stop:6661 length:3690 start_codon:yes stop_codon:yes gene_type:complete
MPESKNSFIQGKMNKDLDPRIIPPGEYIDALNIKVSRSENGDVGVVENVISNKLASDVSGKDATLSTTSAIGHVVDFENRCVYYLVTDFNNANTNSRAASTNKCAIIKYDQDFETTSVVFKSYRFNFNKSFPVYGINILDGYLFWTDNFNQPRVFNVQDTTRYTDDSYLEDKISVAKYAPFCAPKFLQPRYILTVNGAVSNSANVTISAANSALQTAIGNGEKFTVRHDTLDDDVLITSLSGTALVLDEAVTVANGEKLTILSGSMIENTADTTIDNEYMKEKFVRFSYRYKFNDNTYSIFAPFTQVAFEPRIDTFTNDLQTDAYKEAEVATFVNKINQLELEIMLPTLDPSANLLIDEIEILLKESDSIAVKVLDVIDVRSSKIDGLRKDVTTISNGAVGSTKLKAYINNVYSSGVNDRRKELYYVYRSEEPFKTLPASQTNRVFDNVPVKALAQEVAGNRIIYGNFVQGKNLPSNGLNYELSAGAKNQQDEFLDEQLPRHTLKQNRTYVVGVVLADRYGRQSPVIMSKDHRSSILHKRSQISLNGDSLKITFNDPMEENLWSVTNPLGWYSYRVVVKQTLQEYYNVYTPGVTKYDSQQRGGAQTGDGYGYFPIYGDNINKVPRDEVTEGSNIDLSTSSVNLFGIVQNGQTGIQTSKHSVIAIGDLSDFGITADADKNEFYDPDKKYLFSQIKGDYGVLAGNDGANAAALAVFETEPFKSKIDIFYETSTCGLLSDLNAKIKAGGVIPSSLVLRNLADNADDDDFREDLAADSYMFIVKVFDVNGTQLTPSGHSLDITIHSVMRQIDGQTVDVKSDFSVEQIGNTDVHKMKLINAQEYRLSPADTYDVTFRATTQDGANNIQKTIEITNDHPEIGFATGNCVSFTPNTTGTIATINASGSPIYAYNGSANTSLRTERLTFSKVTADSRLDVSSSGVISINTGIPASASGLSITVRATDTGGLTTNASAGGAGDLAIPLCQAQGDVIDVPYSATCSGTKYNYYDRCYGGQGSQDPGDKYQEYFCPDDLTYSNVDGHCNSDFEDILSNNVLVDTTTSGAAVTNFLNNERFTKIFVGGKALVNGAVTSATINIDGHSTNFNVEQNMIVTGTGIPANTTVQTVTSQNVIVLSASVSLSDNTELTFGKEVLDAANTSGVDYFIRIAPHANDTPGAAGYVGNSSSNFIVSIGGADYEYIIGVGSHSGLYADPDNAYPGVRKMVRRSTITTTVYS